MAEFTRKSKSRQNLQSINTARASKQEVYDFYKKWKQQYGIKGKGLSKAASKADLVKELEKIEQIQHETIQAATKARTEKAISKQYEQIKKKELASTPGSAFEEFQKLNRKVEQLKKIGRIDKDTTFFKKTTEKAKPRKKSSQSRARRKQRRNVYYKGKFAHDYIKKMCDDGLIDTEDFEDSREIWYTIDLIKTNSREFDFFEQYYSGSYKKGSRDYYLGKYGFEAFLLNCEQFERAMRAAQKDIPEYGTQEYWNALQEWLAGQEGSTRL